MSVKRQRRIRWAASCIGLFAFVVGMSCEQRSAPPGPASLSSSGTAFSFTYFKWDAGLRIIFVDNVQGGRGFTGSGSTNDSVYYSKGYSGAGDRGYQWTVETTNGISATIKIEGTEYDVANGTVFVVNAENGKIEVHQLKRDMMRIPFESEGCRRVLQDDSEVQEILRIEKAR